MKYLLESVVTALAALLILAVIFGLRMRLYGGF